MYMKGITFQLIAEVVITLAAVFVILAIYYGFLPGFTGPALCKIYQVVLSLPIPSSIKPTVSECSIQPTYERFTISDIDPAKVTDDIATNIINCWQQKAGSGKSGITFICYEIHLTRVDGNVTESGVANILKQKGYCDTLPNNFLDEEQQSFDCGNLNKIYWTATIGGSDYDVIIKYDAFQHRIEVE